MVIEAAGASIDGACKSLRNKLMDDTLGSTCSLVVAVQEEEIARFQLPLASVASERWLVLPRKGATTKLLADSGCFEIAESLVLFERCGKRPAVISEDQSRCGDNGDSNGTDY